MSIRIDGASGDGVSRTDPPTSAFTIMYWFYLLQDTNDFVIMTRYQGGSGAAVGTDGTGTDIMLQDDSLGSSTTHLSLNTWYHVAWVHRSDSDNELYINGTNVVDGFSMATPSGTLLIGGWKPADINYQANSRYDAIKIWSTDLTAAEVAQEVYTIAPRRLTNLYGFWPTFPGASERLADYSGNGKTWTSNGAPSDEDPPPVSWGAGSWFVEIPAAAGGTTHNQSVSGGVTPAGALVKQARAVRAGSVTPTGALLKQASKILAGSVTPTGVLAAVKTALKSLAGTLTLAGALVKQTQRALTGGITPAGALFTQAGKVLAGSITPSGALTAIKTALISLAGSLTPAGTLVKQTGKTLAGSLTPAGALVKQTARALTGTITPTGAIIKQASKTLAGSLSSSGALVRQAGKALAGTLTPSGGVSKLISRTLSGVLSFLGSLIGLSSAADTHATVTISDSLVTTVTATDASKTTVTIGDQLL